ncbi:MAG: NirA family protein [Pirellulales bacterium]
MLNVEFTEEQRQYLAGFVAGTDVARAAKGYATFADTLEANGAGALLNGHSNGLQSAGPDQMFLGAQDRFLAAGKKLCPEEQAKRAKPPLDLWDEIQQHTREKRFPKGTDVLLFKFHGLFYVAPAQNAFMCRLRFAGGFTNSFQFRRVADLAEQFAGGYADLTTRANLQLREIAPTHTIDVLTGLHDAGIVNRGAGADNIRNITAPCTAGIDPQELIDVRPLCRELHHYILHHREMYGLPRKFNIAFDGGGTTTALEDTNDIGFAAVRVPAGGAETEGVYFRVQLGGITGHQDFARDTGLLLFAEECVPVAAAMVRVFIEHGDRTDRKKARLKYLLDEWGFEKFLDETQKRLPFPLRRLPIDQCEPRAPVDKHVHVGVHPQRQPGLSYVGLVLPVGRMQSDQMRAVADIADRFGSGTIRLTVWQNLIISDIQDKNLAAVKAAIEATGLDWRASSFRAGLVACTGSAGCKFAAADTKRHALAIARQLESKLELDQPINIHVTGCPHSCAQHYIGDIGLLATKVPVGDDLVEGYHVYLGGGYGANQAIGREYARNIPADELPERLEAMLRAYLEHRTDSSETFAAFTRRYSTEELRELCEATAQAS